MAQSLRFLHLEHYVSSSSYYIRITHDDVWADISSPQQFQSILWDTLRYCTYKCLTCAKMADVSLLRARDQNKKITKEGSKSENRREQIIRNIPVNMSW